MHREQRVAHVDLSAFVNKNLTRTHPSRTKNTDACVVSQRHELFETRIFGIHVVVHAPQPVGSHIVGSLHSCVEAARAAHVLLCYDVDALLFGEPIGGAVGRTIVYHNDCV